MVQVPTVTEIAAVLLRAPHDIPWANEAGCRHAIRRILILHHRHSWKSADKESRRLVANGRLKANIRMPAGWDSNDISVWIRQKDCDICGRSFEPRKGWHRFCSDRCLWHWQRIRDNPLALKRCGLCAEPFETLYPWQVFCGYSCQRKAEIGRISAARRDVKEGRTCVQCGGPISVEMPATAQFCTSACRNAAYRERQGQELRDRHNAQRRERRRLAKMNGHAAPNGHLHEADPGLADHMEPGEPGGACGGGADQAGAGGREARVSGDD